MLYVSRHSKENKEWNKKKKNMFSKVSDVDVEESIRFLMPS